jgi:hypothetical protein
MEDQYKAGGKPSEVSLRKQFNALKREQFPWMFDLTKCAVPEAIIDLGTACFFEKRCAYPRFKRKDDKPSFCAANEARTFRADGKRSKLPVIGWVRMREEVRFFGPLKRATVSCAAGRWLVSLLIGTNDGAAGGGCRHRSRRDHVGNAVHRRDDRRPEGARGGVEASAPGE